MKPTSTLVAILIVLGFLASGLFGLNDYGYGDDEQWLVKRGAFAAQIVNSIILQEGTIRPDQSEMRADWIHHPSGYALLNYKITSTFLRSIGLNTLESYHLLNLVTAALALWALFCLAREMLGGGIAIYALLFLALYPRFSANAHYNPKDIPAMAGVTISLLFTYRWARIRRHNQAVLAGVFMGLAASAHLNALLLSPVFIFVAGAATISGESTNASPWKTRLSVSTIYLLSIATVLYLLWPVMWINPLVLFQSIDHFTGPFQSFELPYLGEVYPRSRVPWHYLPFYILVSTPLLTLGLILLGFSHCIFDLVRHKRRIEHLMLLSWIALPIVVRVNPWAVKYNDIRHAWISIPPLMIYAGWGFKALLDGITQKVSERHRRLVPPVLAVLASCYFIFQIVPLRPFEGNYFNEAFRLVYSKDIENSFEFPSWLSCYKQGIDWLDKNAEAGAIVSVPYRFSVIGLYDKRSDLVFRPEGPSDYAVIVGLDLQNNPRYRGTTPAFEIRRYNSRIIAIFKTSNTNPPSSERDPREHSRM